MAEIQETIADIIADMRKRFFPYAKSEDSGARYVAYLGYQDFPDRIEAAWNRERVEVREIASTTIIKESVPVAVGNAAAMREVLERVCGWLKRMNKERLSAFAESQITPSYLVNRQAQTIIEDNEYHIGQLEAALSAPPRNCDVGTAEEQANRCLAYCNKHSCKSCPFNTIGRCTLVWSQMPYESEASNG